MGRKGGGDVETRCQVRLVGAVLVIIGGVREVGGRIFRRKFGGSGHALGRLGGGRLLFNLRRALETLLLLEVLR
jgi:hypothetical protein